MFFLMNGVYLNRHCSFLQIHITVQILLQQAGSYLYLKKSVHALLMQSFILMETLKAL